tara:strand:- start:522 stop:1100 length:579 start_codon:yes stop_codon:yes gene_type:complete
MTKVEFKNHDKPWDLTSVTSQTHMLEVIKKGIDLARKAKDEGHYDVWDGFEHEGNQYDIHLELDGDYNNKDDLIYNLEMYGCSKSEEDQKWYTDTDKCFYHCTFDYNGEHELEFPEEKEVGGAMTIIPDEDYVFLYSELAAYVEKRLIGDSTRKTHDKDGQRLPEFDQQFCQICDDVEEILENVLKKESDNA